jgi:hypothetical protein
MRTSTITLAFGLFLTCSGCLLDDTTSNGKTSNNITIVFAGDGGDLASHPIAAGGAQTVIDVFGVSFDGVQSSNPAVATFTVDGGSVDVISGVPGSAVLQLTNAGKVVASSTVFVVNTTALGIVSQGWSGSAPTIVAGATEVLHVTTIGADGNSTRGDGAVRFALSGDLAASVVPVSGDAIGFTGTLPPGTLTGSGTITASCPDTTLAQPITIVDPSLVTSLATTTQPGATNGGTSVVTVVAMTADGAVYTDPCDWTVSAPSVTLNSQTSGLDLGPGDLTVFNLTAPGTFTATCTMAGQSTTVTLQR